MTIFLEVFLQRINKYIPGLLFVTYGVFTIGYFLFPGYSEHYRFYARAVFLPALFVILPSLREIARHPVFRLILVYLGYMIVTSLWSETFSFYDFGQRLTLSIHILGFI